MSDFLLEIVSQLLSTTEKYYLTVLLLYVILHVVFAVLCLPCSTFTFLAGAIWGLELGFLISSTTALIASGTTFAIGRLALSPNAPSLIGHIQIITRAREFSARLIGSGWKSVVAIQGNPIVPASSAGYIFGLSQISPRTFFTATYLSTLPLQLVFVASGSMTQELIILEQTREIVVFVMLLGTLALGLRIIMARKIASPPEKRGDITSGE